MNTYLKLSSDKNRSGLQFFLANAKMHRDTALYATESRKASSCSDSHCPAKACLIWLLRALPSRTSQGQKPRQWPRALGSTKAGSLCLSSIPQQQSWQALLATQFAQRRREPRIDSKPDPVSWSLLQACKLLLTSSLTSKARCGFCHLLSDSNR